MEQVSSEELRSQIERINTSYARFTNTLLFGTLLTIGALGLSAPCMPSLVEREYVARQGYEHSQTKDRRSAGAPSRPAASAPNLEQTLLDKDHSKELTRQSEMYRTAWHRYEKIRDTTLWSLLGFYTILVPPYLHLNRKLKKKRRQLLDIESSDPGYTYTLSS